MLAQPIAPLRNCDRLKLCCGDSGRDCCVVNLSDRWQIRLNSVANDHIQGFRFLIWLRVMAGDLPGVGVKLAAAVATGLESGNANVGEIEADAVADAVGDGAGP